MLTKKNILAIFKKNYFLEHLLSLFEDEGIKIEKIKSLKNLNYQIHNKILLVDIDSVKTLKEVEMKLNKNTRNCIIFGFCSNENLKKDNDTIRIINTPILFNDLLNQIKKISFKDQKLNIEPKIGKFFINFQTYELINNSEKKFYKLTELETKFLKFLYENKGGSKIELLTNVWGHNKILDTHTLESLIYRIRKKIEKNTNEPKFLIFKNGRYYLNAD